MKYIKKAVCCMCVMLVGLLLISSEVMAYDRHAAAAYAKLWAYGFNTAEYYQAPADCTNFVSQCLEKGGMTRSSASGNYTNTNIWRPHTATWENATYFRKYWKTRANYTKAYILTNTNKPEIAEKIYLDAGIGDIVQYGYGEDDIRHSQIVIGYEKKDGNTTLVLAQHTAGSDNKKLAEYINRTSYTYVTFYHFYK